MYCNICGNEKDTQYITTKYQTLCRLCNIETPAKISREMFDRLYWEGKEGDVPTGIKHDFYGDYLASTSDFETYKKETSGGGECDNCGEDVPAGEHLCDNCTPICTDDTPDYYL